MKVPYGCVPLIYEDTKVFLNGLLGEEDHCSGRDGGEMGE